MINQSFSKKTPLAFNDSTKDRDVFLFLKSNLKMKKIKNALIIPLFTD